MKTTMTRVLRTLDGEVLRLAATAVPTVRPPFIDRSSLPVLRDLLSFRYFARHGYHADIDPTRVGDLARAGVTLCPDLSKSSHAFADFLAEQTPA